MSTYSVCRKRCKKPIVTAVQGIVFTIGIELMLAGDIVVAADDSRFCQMESKRGIAPLGGAHFRFLSRTGWGNAMYHLFLCDEFTAPRAREIGLVQEVVPAGQQVERAMALAAIIAGNAPLGIQVTKEAALKYIEHGEAGGHRLHSGSARAGAQQRRCPRRAFNPSSSGAPRCFRDGEANVKSISGKQEELANLLVQARRNVSQFSPAR